MLQNSLLNRQRHFNQEVLCLLIDLCIESEWEGVSLLWSLRSDFEALVSVFPLNIEEEAYQEASYLLVLIVTIY